MLDRILARGAYVSQFVTATSNGGLTALDRGARWQWEHRIFDGAYDDSTPVDRPVYGALVLTEDPYGPAPRFGSAYLLLRAAVTKRSTFAYPDSTFQPAAVGVGEASAWAELMRTDPQPDPLDRYVEAHVHSGVAVPVDVEALVLDPCFGGLGDRAARAGLRVDWHPGYRLDLSDADQPAELGAYRGRAVVDLARRLATDGILEPTDLGRARGRSDIEPQQLKQAWHLLARFGRSAPR